MNRMTRFKIGLVAALWGFIVAAAFAGWMIGHGSAELKIAELEQRLAARAAPKPSCGTEIELLKARSAETSHAADIFGVTLGGLLPHAPQRPHPRETPTEH